MLITDSKNINGFYDAFESIGTDFFLGITYCSVGICFDGDYHLHYFGAHKIRNFDICNWRKRNCCKGLGY